MKALLLSSFLFLQIGGTGGPGGNSPDHCQGCFDLSAEPDFVTLETGDCISYTTAELTFGRDGQCVPSGGTCSSEPCRPELSLRHHQETVGNGVYVSGIVGDIRFGPIKMVGGNDVEIYRGSVNLACGAESPYYFEIIGDCATTDSNEQVYGSFVCTSCVRQ